MKILLHICCGVCAAGVARTLTEEGHQVIGFFYNPNIHPEEEYHKRLDAARRAAQELAIPLVVACYDPDRWLKEKDPKMRRYYACHCQLAREAILNDVSEPLGTFCYCSAGYEKLPLEVILGVPLKVEVLESALAGGERCRFSIKIPKDKLK